MGFPTTPAILEARACYEDALGQYRRAIAAVERTRKDLIEAMIANNTAGTEPVYGDADVVLEVARAEVDAICEPTDRVQSQPFRQARAEARAWGYLAAKLRLFKNDQGDIE